MLVSDRANCSSEMMEMMKNDIIEVISRYMDIDAEALDVKITETESDSNNGTVPALVANIPIRDMKHRPNRDRNYRVHKKMPGRFLLAGRFYNRGLYDTNNVQIGIKEKDISSCTRRKSADGMF